jgi:dolichyl-phosphate-mannose--protein O-mannosyl transferase
LQTLEKKTTSEKKLLSKIFIEAEFRDFFVTFAAARSFHVTCGTVLKLLNSDYKVRLHSHDVKYGTGSGQQSVTGIELQEDVNSHWAIWAATGETCDRG